MRLNRTLRFILPLTPLVAMLLLGAASKPPTPTPKKSGGAEGKSRRVSFHEEIEPLLKANCVGCHSKESAGGGFAIDSPEALRKGGQKSGSKVIVPGSASISALIAYLNGTLQPRMPMGLPPLPEAQIKLISTWINQGAIIDPPKLGWPYTPPAPVTVPSVKDAAWPKNDIDRFVLAKLEAKGLKPAPAASRTVLVRRLYLDLIGVPPSPTEVERFFADTSPQAYERLVDRLLADPRYGERWARHWLDLVRYADTHGFEQDNIRPRAWRYRDYVIRSLNADKPYDRFLKEQIAGDELYPNDPDALIATGFARLGPWDELSNDAPQRWQDYLNDVTDTTGSVMLGMTVGCARCHDHKYDRISQADYYRLQSFFASTRWTNHRLPEESQPVAYREEVTTTQEKIHLLREQVKIATAAMDEKTADSLKQQADSLQRQIAPIESVAEGITDNAPKPLLHHILLRGNLSTPGAEAPAAFPTSFCGGKETRAVPVTPPGRSTTGLRSALANWIGSPTNPMTARVIVNRLWQYHLGRGIVGTPSDFGKNGDKPSHPELLDYLAEQFIADGWSLKKMHRRILLSATYRQSLTENPRAARLDPSNTLLWRMNRIRLDAEALRDSVLAISGRLNPETGGPGVYPKLSAEVLSTGSTHKWGDSSEEQQRRRTIYVFQRRSLGLPMVETFDGPDMINTCPRRNTTTIAPQALALFNGAFSREEAHYFAVRVTNEAGTDADARIKRAYRIALCRTPTTAEILRAKNYLTRKQALYTTEGKAVEAPTRALDDFCHVLINTNEFLYLD